MVRATGHTLHPSSETRPQFASSTLLSCLRPPSEILQIADGTYPSTFSFGSSLGWSSTSGACVKRTHHVQCCLFVRGSLGRRVQLGCSLQPWRVNSAAPPTATMSGLVCAFRRCRPGGRWTCQRLVADFSGTRSSAMCTHSAESKDLWTMPVAQLQAPSVAQDVPD